MANRPFPGGPLVDQPKGGSQGDIVDLPGPTGRIISPHEVDGNTLFHLEWNGDLTDEEGTLSVTSGVYTPVPVDGGNVKGTAFPQDGSIGFACSYAAAVDPDELSQFTFATWFYVTDSDTNGTGNVVARHSLSNGGFAAFNVGFGAPNGGMFLGWDVATTYTEINPALSANVNEWNWVGVTYDDGSGIINLNGDEVEHSIGAIGAAGNGVWRFGTKFDGGRVLGGLYSTIFKNVALTSEQLEALRASTLTS